MKKRDEFSKKVILELERRVNGHCSNPDRPVPTSGPTGTHAGAINIGVAAHICAASPGGPRYDPGMTPEERAGIENGIWLCQSCAKMIDSDPATYTVSSLKRWRRVAEQRAQESLGLIPISKERYAVLEAAVFRTSPGSESADPVGTICDLTVAALQQIDPRFRVSVAREGKLTTYNYEATEPISGKVIVKREFANEFTDKFDAFVRHGEDLSITAEAVSFEGLPLFERLSPQGGKFGNPPIFRAR